MKTTKRICLWSGPRNISTTLMYSFAQRKDTKVFDEPLYAHYLTKTNAKEYHPGAAEIIKSMESDGNKVVEQMINNNEKPVLFFKNMTHHLLDLDRTFLNQKGVYNVLLTRHPKEMIPSFDKVVKNPTMNDIGYANHTELLKYFKQNGITPIVLDSTKILKNPKRVLKKLCDFIEIPFTDSMLSWSKGARDEDGVWANHWYENVHSSTGFLEYKPKSEPFPQRLIPLLEESLEHYNELLKYTIE